VALVYLIPIYALVVLAIGSPGRGGSLASILAPVPTFANFATAWTKSGIGLALANSAIIASGSVILLVLLAGMAGYTIERFPTRFNKAVFAVLLGCMMIPGIINTVPLYSLMFKIGGMNTRWAMVLVLACNALPFAVFLYTGFIKTIPREIEEASIIDGCSPTRSFFAVTLPLLAPVTASIVILDGVGFWNNYGQAVFFLQRRELRTVPLAVSMFFQQYGAHWNLVAAASLIGLAPVLVVFLAFQKSFVKGISAGAVK
jgi:ABC-type sugar transport system, permease component